MKIAFITDTHFGVHKCSDVFLNSQLKFFNEEFIPYLEKNNIETIVFGGDIFDSRNSINVKIMNSVFNLFEKLNNKNYKIYVIVGNHDIYYKTTIDVNSLQMLKKFNNVEVVEDITMLDNILLVPWQVEETKFSEYLIDNKIETDICIGHFDINGFKQTKNQKSIDGFSIKNFDRFKIVFSGHFHLRDEIKKDGTNFIYAGSPYHLDRNDINTDKGFCIIDTESLDYEFINNTTSIKYVSIKYPEIIDNITNNIVDVYVDYNSEYDEAEFKKYLNNIEKLNPIEVSVKLINNFLSGEEVENIEELDLTNTENIIKEYILNLDVKQKDAIDELIFDLYSQCKEI